MIGPQFSPTMFQKLCLLLISAAFLTGVTACKKKETAAERQARVVQTFRNKQKIEAIKAYTALVEKYPDSEFAPKAKERLGVLGPLPAATPAAKKK
jgi:outer membrane protein assembly factor BamD (BamD/ComL family)